MDRRSKVAGVDVGLFAVARELAEPIALSRQLALALPKMGLESRASAEQQLVMTSERALLQIEDLVRMSKLEASMFELEPVAVRGVCDEITAEMARALGMKMSVEYRNRNRLAVANRELLGSVVRQLCWLGVRNSERGVNARLVVTEAKGKMRVEVRDFGPRMPRDAVRMLRTGRMERLVDGEMRLGGLGLVVTDRFMQFMHGNMGVVTHRDGNSVYVELGLSKQMCLC